MSSSRKVAYVPECSTFSLSSLGYIILKDLTNSLPSLMTQKSPINFPVP